MQLKDKTVLVVDDEKDLCEILASELADLGARPLLAHNVPEALAIIEAQQVDLVISDIRMPGASGVELLDSIRRQHIDLPVVLVTGFADITVAEALARGAEAVMQKPYDMDQLFELCKRLVKPLTERWMKTFDAAHITRVPQDKLSYGRGGFFVNAPTGPQVGALFHLTVDRGEKPGLNFEVVCRWGRDKDKGEGPAGWGAEITAWDEEAQKTGWPHADKLAFIPLK